MADIIQQAQEGVIVIHVTRLPLTGGPYHRLRTALHDQRAFLLAYRVFGMVLHTPCSLANKGRRREPKTPQVSRGVDGSHRAMQSPVGNRIVCAARNCTPARETQTHGSENKSVSEVR